MKIIVMKITVISIAVMKKRTRFNICQWLSITQSVLRLIFGNLTFDVYSRIWKGEQLYYKMRHCPQ